MVVAEEDDADKAPARAGSEPPSRRNSSYASSSAKSYASSPAKPAASNGRCSISSRRSPVPRRSNGIREGSPPTSRGNARPPPLSPSSPSKGKSSWPTRQLSPVSSALQQLMCRFDQHRSRFKDELRTWRNSTPVMDFAAHMKGRMKDDLHGLSDFAARVKDDLHGWRLRIKRKGGKHTGPELLKVEPIVPEAGNPHVMYRAQLSIAVDGEDHAWQTEPFSFDDLVAVVVSSRIAHATAWCSQRVNDQKDSLRRRRSRCDSEGAEGRGQKRSRYKLRYAVIVGAILATWLLGRLLQPALRRLRESLSTSLHALKEENFSLLSVSGFDLEWVLANLAAMALWICVVGLLAGVTEVSFLPAKAVLHLERKDETDQVWRQLQLLIGSGDCLQRLDVCDFLNLGMPAFYGSSETQKEGRCLCRCYESSEAYFGRSRRRRCACLFFSCDFRFTWQGRRQGMQERWLVLRKDGIALYRSRTDKWPADMLFFNSGFSLFRDDGDHVLVSNTSWFIELDFGEPFGATRGKAQAWCNAITLTAQLSPFTHQQRFGSFAPVRYGKRAKPDDRHVLRRSLARHLIGGRVLFRKVAEAILIAEHEIFMLGFWITPELRMVREGESLPNDADPQLAALLKSAANRGVRVFVLVFHETMLPNDSEWAESELRHPNIFVCRYREQKINMNLLWCNHEKVVVIDQQMAFVGGIDLALGRYEDSRYRLRDDASPHVWEAQDYSNPRIMDFVNVRAGQDILDRHKQARLPWQDITCQVLGRSVRDVARHCIERWNFAKARRPQCIGLPTVTLRRKVALSNDAIVAMATQQESSRQIQSEPNLAQMQFSDSTDTSWPRDCGPWYDCGVQVTRSVTRWSAGTMTESSIHACYCNLVQGAERFVYIENQFLCSGLDGDDEVGNRVIEAVFLRILRAHKQQENFHVMIVLPLLPALDGKIEPNISSPLLTVMDWQYRTLRGLRSRLTDEGVDMADYLSVYGLRTHDTLESGPVTEQVYIHSKVMVVDDRWAVVGSANLNERSLLGVRDSELNVVLRDSDTAEALLGGPWKAGGFASNLRKTLFSQHLGWSLEEIEGKYADPLSKGTLQEVKDVARRNTEIYEEVFAPVPTDAVRSWAQLAARRAEFQLPGDATRIPTAEQAQALASVKGHLVEFPLDFLAEEDLSPSGFSAGAMAPDTFN